MEVRSLGYRTDLMVLALEGSQITDHGGYLAVRSPASPDYWWGNFLLLPAAGAGDAARWLAAFRAEFPAARHVALGVDVTAPGEADLSGFETAGLRPERSAVLTAREPSAPPRPSGGAEYRELRGDGDWQQAAGLRAAVNAGEPGSEPGFIRARIAAERAMTGAGNGAWFGAFAGGRLVAHLGVVSDGSGVARYQDVETHPDWRRRGLAGTLVWRAGQYAVEQLGARTLVIVADPDAGAIRVYRRAGFADAQTQVRLERRPA